MTKTSKPLYVSTALREPFGLTIIESAAIGLPFVATRNGGPQDIVANLGAGALVDPLNPEEIAEALWQIVSDRRL